MTKYERLEPTPPEERRLLDANEQAVLRMLVDALPADEQSAIRSQLGGLELQNQGWFPTDIAFFPTAGIPLASGQTGPLAVTAYISADGESVTGGIMLWVTHGWLSSFEYFWFTDYRPTEFPLAAQVQDVRYVPFDQIGRG